MRVALLMLSRLFLSRIRVRCERGAAFIVAASFDYPPPLIKWCFGRSFSSRKSRNLSEIMLSSKLSVWIIDPPSMILSSKRIADLFEILFRCNFSVRSDRLCAIASHIIYNPSSPMSEWVKKQQKLSNITKLACSFALSHLSVQTCEDEICWFDCVFNDTIDNQSVFFIEGWCSFTNDWLRSAYFTQTSMLWW